MKVIREIVDDLALPSADTAAGRQVREAVDALRQNIPNIPKWSIRTMNKKVWIYTQRIQSIDRKTALDPRLVGWAQAIARQVSRRRVAEQQEQAAARNNGKSSSGEPPVKEKRRSRKLHDRSEPTVLVDDTPQFSVVEQPGTTAGRNGDSPAASFPSPMAEEAFHGLAGQVVSILEGSNEICRECWDHKSPLLNLTKIDPIKATGTHISMIAHCTPDELHKSLRSTDVRNGFGNRFLWVAAKGVKAVSRPEAIDWTAHPEIVKRLQSIVKNFQDPVEIGFTPRGQAAWDKWYIDHYEQRQTLKGSFAELAGRCEAHVLRLAMIYTVLDDQRLIDEAHLGAAWTFWRYCADSIRWAFSPDEARLTAPSGFPPFAVKRANKLLAALQAHPEGMTRTQISAVFAGNLPQDRIEEALDLLRKSESAVEKPVVGSKIPRWFSAENAEDEKHEKN